LYYHALRWPVYWTGWFCQFATVDSIIWKTYFHDFLLLILVHAHVSVSYLILLLFPCTC
jgi:hypothetical protein